MNVNMKIKRKYILFYLVLFLGITSQYRLSGMPGKGMETGNPQPYGNYLTIKYYMHLNQFEKAENAINKYLDDHPQDPFILTEKAFLLSEVKGEYEEALGLLNKSKAIYPQYYYANYLHALILFNLTNIVSKTDSDTVVEEKVVKEKENDARKYLEIAIKDNPGFYDAHNLLGVILNTMGEYRESNRYFEQANRLKQTITSYLYMASNYRHLNDTDGVVNSYKKILSLSPLNNRALLSLARIYLEKNEYKSAVVYLEKLFRNNPQDHELAHEYLYSLVAAGETKKFMETVNQVDISNIPILLYSKALLLIREKKFNQAEQTLKMIKSKDLRMHLLQVEIHLHRHDYFKAYEVLEKVEPGKKNYLFYSMKLHILSRLNMNQKIIKLYHQLRDNSLLLEKLAVEDFYTFLFAGASLNLLETVKEMALAAKTHIKEHPEFFSDLNHALQGFSPDKDNNIETMKFPQNVFLIETFYKNQEQYKHAVSIIKKLIQKNADIQNQNAYLELCDIYQQQKQFEKAEHLLEKLLKQFPSSPRVKNYYAYFLALQNKNLEQALELSADTLSGDKENPAYNDTYGYILFRLGRFSDAGKHLEKAYRKQPFEQDIMEHLVDYYRSCQDSRESLHQRIIDIYQKAIDNDVDFKEQLIKKIEKLENDKKNHP